MLEKTLERPLDCKEIKPVYPKGDQSWVFIGGTDAEAETPILWPPDAKSWIISKDPDAGKDWGQEEKGTTEDELAKWHHGLDGHESEWTLGVDDGTGRPGLLQFVGLQWVGHDWATELKWTEMNWTELIRHLASSLAFTHQMTVALSQLWQQKRPQVFPNVS